jgi:hypothetical protein
MSPSLLDCPRECSGKLDRLLAQVDEGQKNALQYLHGYVLALGGRTSFGRSIGFTNEPAPNPVGPPTIQIRGTVRFRLALL